MKESRVRIGDAAKVLGVTPQTLRNWEKIGKLVPQRSVGAQRYYVLADIQRLKIDVPKLAWVWAASAQPAVIPNDMYCERQDRFTSRVEKMGTLLLHELGAQTRDIVSLVTLVVGEIGDNSFAHNAGNWPDVLGVFFSYDINKRIIVLADRGQGVRQTLQRVRPAIASDVDALHVAFTEVVSGRDPEKRGNGLKVIRQVAEEHPIGLLFRSGIGLVQIPKEAGQMKITMAKENIRGVYAVISF